MLRIFTLVLLISLGAISFAQRVKPATLSPPSSSSLPDTADLKKMAERFALTPLQVDTSALSAGDKRALVKLIEAARVVNHLFMQQLWRGDLALYQKLQQDRSALGQARLHYFWINKGPWSEIDEQKAFLPGVPAKKPPAQSYPEDMTKEEFEAWVSNLSASERVRGRLFLCNPPRLDKKLQGSLQ
jgi:hypothetical protein